MTPFTGGRRFMLGSAVAGALGVLLTAVGVALNPAVGWSSCLLAFTYWTGLAMASLTPAEKSVRACRERRSPRSTSSSRQVTAHPGSRLRAAEPEEGRAGRGALRAEADSFSRDRSW